MAKYYTLAFITNGENEVLLGMKKRGFAEGKWNGFGGKIEKGEEKYEAAIREIKEECDLNVLHDDLKYLGYVHVSRIEEESVVYIFFVDTFEGDPKESDEMRPQWFKIDSLPYDDMLIDAREWIPLVLEQKRFVAHFTYEDLLIVERNIQIGDDGSSDYSLRRDKLVSAHCSHNL